MLSFRPQSTLALIVITAAMVRCGASARAGYVSLAELTGHNGVGLLSPSAEHEASGWMNEVRDTPQPQFVGEDAPAPSDHVPSLLDLLHAACNYALGNEPGRSSPSASGNGSSSPSAGDLPRPNQPSPQTASLLPPQTGAAHPFSIASWVFRPPRAV